MRTLAVCLFILALPALSAAAGAGFPSSSLWLSNDAPQSGDEVRVFSVLYNGETAAVSGTLQFLVDGEVLDTESVSLEPDASRILSTHWTAREGSHTISAKFDDGGSAGVRTSGAITVSVSAPPSPTKQALDSAQSVAAHAIASSTPVVKQLAQAVVDTTEGLREAGIEYLEGIVEKPTENQSSSSTTQIGLSTEESTSTESGSPSLVKNASQLAAAGALFAFKSAWLFYFLLLALLYLIFRTVKNWVNRPRF